MASPEWLIFSAVTTGVTLLPAGSKKFKNEREMTTSKLEKRGVHICQKCYWSDYSFAGSALAAPSTTRSAPLTYCRSVAMYTAPLQSLTRFCRHRTSLSTRRAVSKGILWPYFLVSLGQSPCFPATNSLLSRQASITNLVCTYIGRLSSNLRAHLDYIRAIAGSLALLIAIMAVEEALMVNLGVSYDS